MHIGVDLDSVLAEIIPAMDRFHNETYHTKIKLADHKSFNLSEVWGGTSDDAYNKLLRFQQSAYFDIIKPVKGARRGIAGLNKKHTLSVITARPYLLEKKTIAWLDKYFPKKFKHIYHTNQAARSNEPFVKKSEIGKKLGIEMMIEDNLDFAIDIVSIGVPVFLFDQPWNRVKKLPKGITRVYSWREIRL